MDFFNSPFFSINKRLLSILGLWPRQDYLKKILIRSFFGALSIIFCVPHLISLYVYAGEDSNKLAQSLANVFYILEVSLKMLMTIVTEDRIQIMFENISVNWKLLKDEEEVKILLKHSETGKFFTILYLSYMILALILFITLPMFPLIFDTITSSNGSQTKFLILNGEYLVDLNKHYAKAYTFEGLTCILSVLVVTAIDTTYVVCVQQCIGLMDVVKTRLSLTKKNVKYNEIPEKSAAHISMVQTVQFHQKAIDFANVLESTYAINFLSVISINVTILSLGCIIILMNLTRPIEILRFTMICAGLTIHIFFLSWPGQQMLDISSDILKTTYSNKWYELSMKTKKTLLFMMMRCKDPCQLTAGGIYVMNVANFGAIIKTSLSYITVFSSML